MGDTHICVIVYDSSQASLWCFLKKLATGDNPSSEEPPTYCYYSGK